jgi:hypothetical protein
MYTIPAYLIYLVFSLITVFVVGKNLHRNGKYFLFGECPDEAISSSANNFLYVGYCLVNSAFALFFLSSRQELLSLVQVIEFIANTQGTIFISLGLLHILNLIIAPRITDWLLRKKLLTNKK